MLKAAAVLVRDAAGFVGVGLIAYGVREIYPPAGFIVLGAFLLIGVWLLSKRSS